MTDPSFPPPIRSSSPASSLAGDYRSWDPVSLEEPPVLFWFRIYAGLHVLAYVLVAIVGFLLGMQSGSLPSDSPDIGAVLSLSLFYVLYGTILALAFGATFFLPRKPWVWVVSLALIILTVIPGVGCCFLLAIPLLIFWLSGDVRRWYGMN